MNSKHSQPLDLAQFEGHTPGPWGVYDAHSTIQIDPPGKSGERPAIVLWSGFDGNDMSVEQNRRNARLIAAAPALLAECRRLRAEEARLVALLATAQALRPSLLKDYGAVPECVLDFCNRARAALSGASL